MAKSRKSKSRKGKKKDKKYCAPGKGGDGYTCFTKESLVKMAKAFNKRNPNSHIPISGRTKRQLWETLRSRMSDQCNTEICWLDQKFVKNIDDPEITEHTFVPEKPEEWEDNPVEWLSSTDIDAVMRQYERRHPHFMFIGPVPSDCPNGFTCELTRLDPVKLHKKGITQVGIIYNLDKHWQPGSHWVAVFLDLRDHGDLTYYDSVGSPPPRTIETFLQGLQKRLAKAGIPVKYAQNTRRHQFGDTECGIYSMNYIMRRLEGKSMRTICSQPLPDKVMFSMRDYLYRPRV